MPVTIKEISHALYGKCLHIDNGLVELVATIGFGPRIIHFSIAGGKNVFAEVGYDKNCDQYQLVGGHRLWHSPEAMPRSYEVDSGAVHWEVVENGVRLIQKPEAWAQMEKSMEIVLDERVPGLTVNHIIYNRGAWPVELSAWAITMMAPGGMEVVPMPSADTGLLPNRVIGLWPYSSMRDQRVQWGEKYITLAQDKAMEKPFKLGVNNEHSWAAYFINGQVFIKQHIHNAQARYPDGGLSFETYVNGDTLEMETLSPITAIGPNEGVEHAEYWALIDNFPCPMADEESLEEAIGQIIDENGCGCEDCQGCDECAEDCQGCDGCAEDCREHESNHHHHH